MFGGEGDYVCGWGCITDTRRTHIHIRYNGNNDENEQEALSDVTFLVEGGQRRVHAHKVCFRLCACPCMWVCGCVGCEASPHACIYTSRHCYRTLDRPLLLLLLFVVVVIISLTTHVYTHIYHLPPLSPSLSPQVLCLRSPYFHSLFTGGMRESREREVI